MGFVFHYNVITVSYIYSPPEKKTLNQMVNKPTDGPLLATISPLTTSQTTVTISSPVTSITAPNPVTSPPIQQGVQPLTNIFVALEAVQPGEFQLITSL